MTLPNNGLLIDENEFCNLSIKDQNLILYRNQVKTLSAINGYRLYYRLTTIIGTFLVMSIGILFKLHIGGI